MSKINNEDLKKAIAATKIKWPVVEKWRVKLKYNSNEDMLLDWMHDRSEVYYRGLMPHPNPFHRHVRVYLDTMEHLGISSIDALIDQGLQLTKKQIKEYKDKIDEDEEEV